MTYRAGAQKIVGCSVVGEGVVVVDKAVGDGDGDGVVVGVCVVVVVGIHEMVVHVDVALSGSARHMAVPDP